VKGSGVVEAETTILGRKLELSFVLVYVKGVLMVKLVAAKVKDISFIKGTREAFPALETVN
jgi:hypothetical protein